MEHRCGYRRAIDVAVVVRTAAGLVGRAALCDVSSSGARLTSSLTLRPETEVLIQFTIRGATGVRHRKTIKALVARRTDDGFAVEWAEFAPAAVRELFTLTHSSATDDAQPAHRVRRGH